MDFFEHQDRAQRKTKHLVVFFVLAVALIILAVYLAFVLALTGFHAKAGKPLAIWNPELFFSVAGGTVLVVLLGSLYKIWELSKGGEAVAAMLGGRLIEPSTKDLNERKLLNVVEEMAIASGMPVPPVFLLEERSINAFAAGFSPTDAVVGVTRGCMELLNRDELQGVIAHEFSHILNGDMRVNIRLIGVLNGILIIGILGYVVMRATAYGGASTHRRGRSDKGGGGALAIFVLGLLLMAIGYIGVFFGKLIKSALSRQREYLADASSVQFTRNPGGIASALKKIGGLSLGSGVSNEHAEEASHMFFGNALRPAFFNLLATHPPLDERIRRIDPAFDGTFPAVTRAAAEASLTQGGASRLQPGVSRFDASAGTAAPRNVTVEPGKVVDQVGAPQVEHLRYAEKIVASIPDQILAEIREPYGARAVIYGLLTDADDAVARKQARLLAERADAAVCEETRKLLPVVRELSPHCRLPLVDLAIPALQRMSPAQYQSFRRDVEDLAGADEEIDLFEYTLQRVLLRNLGPKYGVAQSKSVQYYSLSGLTRECAQLLSTLAHVGQMAGDEGAVRRAFESGLAELRFEPGSLALVPADACGLASVDAALDRLGTVSPKCKRTLISACAACISADRQVTVQEAELLRAIAASLDCPTPPLLADAA